MGLIVPQGDDVRANFFDDGVFVRVLAPKPGIVYFRTRSHGGKPLALVVFGLNPLYLPNSFVAGDNHKELSTQFLCLPKKISMPWVQDIESTEDENAHGHRL